MRVSNVLLVALGVLLPATFPASAALVTDYVTFTATGFTTDYGQAPPVNPVTGSFTITYDPTLNYMDDTVDITSNSLNIALDSALAFTYYNPASNPSGFSPDELIVGGIEDAGCNGGNTGSECVQISPSTNDFTLQIDDFSTTPTFGFLGYSQTSAGSQAWFYTTSATAGSVAVTPVVVPLPVPGPITTFALLAVGIFFVELKLRANRRNGGESGGEPAHSTV